MTQILLSSSSHVNHALVAHAPTVLELLCLFVTAGGYAGAMRLMAEHVVPAAKPYHRTYA